MTKNYANLFVRWYNNVFHMDPMFHRMTQVSEKSPWHRERNVGVHTDMVVNDYLLIAGDTWIKDHVQGALACAFHDVGKPRAAEINGTKFKPERGYYLSFGGHEPLSARMWEDYAVRNWAELRDTFDLVPFDIFVIGWMIEYHLPWGIKKADKLDQLALTTMYTCEPDTFANFVLADTMGRISDDEIEKRAKVNDWINNFHLEICARQHSLQEYPDDDQPRLIMPIGASGSGKSTFWNTIQTGRFAEFNRVDFEHYSWDALRHEFYETDDYAEAFRLSCADKRFGDKVNKRYMELVKEGKNIYVDNTNTSKKRRAYFIHEARRKGYHVTGIILPVDMATVIARQKTRDDKNVPTDAVERQYWGVQYPSYGEFDRILVSTGNLPA